MPLAKHPETQGKRCPYIKLDTDEDFTDPHRFPWTGGEGIVTCIAANSFWHYREHAEQIRAML